MTEDVMVVNGNRALGPFPDAAAAALYLSELGHDSVETVPVTAPPLVTPLLRVACALLQENRTATTDDLYDAIAGTSEEGVSQKRIEAVLEEARALLNVLSPDRSELSDVELAKLIYKEELDRGGNRVTALKALRVKRGIGAIEARDIMRKAGLYRQ